MILTSSSPPYNICCFNFAATAINMYLFRRYNNKIVVLLFGPKLSRVVFEWFKRSVYSTIRYRSFRYGL